MDLTSVRSYVRHARGLQMLTITPLSDRTGLRLDGEVDVSNAHRLTSAVRQLRTPGCSVLEFELAGLRFIDVVGARALVAAAHGRGRPPARLVLHHPPATLTRVISLLWPDSEVEIRAPQPAGVRPLSSIPRRIRRRQVDHWPGGRNQPALARSGCAPSV